MKMGRAGAIHRDLGQLFEGRAVAGLGEVQLLDRFVDRRDEPALAALVARHGPMVLGVCRRLLADPNDVEDAFQATFLVLVRRAGSLRGRDQLAPWLFGVARKVATRARIDLARRRAVEQSMTEDFASIPSVDNENRELGRALIEEIDRLPESLREPIVLCCLEGLSYDEAASRLRTTTPAIRGKLSRGRERLRVRLTRRGFAPSSAVLGVLLAESVVSAAIPRALFLTTTRASLAGTFPIGVEALAEGVIQTMILTKSKILATALVAFGVAGSTMGLHAQDGGRTPAPKTETSEADRFSQIEKKLDRLIEALEGSSRRRDFITQYPSTIVMPTLPPAAALAPLVPPPPTPPTPPDSPNRATGRARNDGQDIATNNNRAIFGFSGSSPDSGRLDAVEAKLESLEARIANLERRLGPERASRGQQPARNLPTRSRSDGAAENPDASYDLPTPRRSADAPEAPTAPSDDERPRSETPRPARKRESTTIPGP